MPNDAADLVLRLYEDTIPARCPPIVLPGTPRALYVKSGGLAVEDASGARWLTETAAHVDDRALVLQAAELDSTVWRWELDRPGVPASAPLPSAPATQSVLKLEAPVHLDRRFEWLMRCDRVDFPPGGVALTHVHQGPGIRITLHGQIRIETQGTVGEHAPGDAWFELGHAPVLAPTTEDGPTAFVRCFLLPRGVKGQSSIRYVRAEDAAAKKVQQYRVFAERFVELPAA